MAGAVDALMLVLGDQPSVRAATLQQLVDGWRQRGTRLALPTYHGQRGHPVILAAALLPEIQALRHPQTLRDLVHANLPLALELAVDDPGVVGDVDTPEEYRRAIAKWEQAQI